MELSIPREKLAKRRLMIGTPMYEGLCHGAYTAALVGLGLRLRELGVSFKLSFIVNQPSPERGRAMILDEFLRSDCTHLAFIDADVVVQPEDVVGLLALQGAESPYDVIGGSYPRKAVDWGRVARAAASGVAAGELARHGGDTAVNLMPDAREIALDGPVEVATISAGFSMVRRATFERLIERYPDLAYVADERERRGHGLGTTLYKFYSTAIDPATRVMRSEDFAFCDRVRAAGMKVWLCPWMHADHIGNFRFSGTLSDALRLDSATSPAS